MTESGMEKPKLVVNSKGEERVVVPESTVKAPTFLEIEDKLKEKGIDEDEKRFLTAERNKIIDDVKNFDGGRYLDDVRFAVITKAKESTWDQVYTNLQNLGKNLDQQLQGAHGANPRWKGVVEKAVSSEAARTIIAGVDSRNALENKSGFGLPSEWFTKHGYSTDTIKRLETSLKDGHIYDLLPDSPEDVVGKLVPKKIEVIPSPVSVASPDPTMDALLNVALDQRQLTQEQLNALQRGFNVLVGLTETKTAISPDVWETQPPYWYEQLSRGEKEAVKNVLIFNYISGQMVKTGEASYQPWAAIGDPEKGYVPLVSAEAIKYQWENFPGFRVALSTMTEDLFTKGRATGSFSIRADGVSHKGYDLMSNTTDFVQYKHDLASALIKYYQDRPDDLRWANDRHMKVDDMATLMVSMADNFLMGTTSYLAGDTKRPYDMRNNDGGSFQSQIEDPGQNGGDDIRAFLNPGLKLWKKMYQEDGDRDRKEEYWMGTFGKWMRFNTINNIDGFRDDFRAGKIHYVPDKLFPGLLEFTILIKDGKKKTAADLLVNVEKENLGYSEGLANLVDYKEGAESINFASNMPELFGDYSGKRVQAIKLYENISSTGGQRTNAISVDALFNALVRLKKMGCVNLIPELKEAYTSKDFIIANLAQIISQGNGPVMGIREIVLNLPDPRSSYDAEVNHAISGQANIYNDVGITREEILKVFHAYDKSSFSAESVFSSMGLGSTILSEREQLKRKAIRNIERVSQKF